MKASGMSVLFGVAVFLTACGGVSSGGGSGNNVYLSGIVSDGYIKGAIVCLDKNKNKKCDTGEPTATTGAGGSYSLEVSTADQARYPVIAVVGADAIDEDNPGQPIGNDYILTTPPGKHEVVSPLTTMINNELEKSPALGSDGAEAIIKQKLGYIPGDAVSLYADYVAAAQDTGNANQADYERLHTVAKVVARAVASNKDLVEGDLSGSAYTLDEVLDEVIDIIVAQVIAELATIAADVDAGTPVDTIAGNVTTGTSAASIEDDIAAQKVIADSSVATSADITEMYAVLINGPSTNTDLATAAGITNFSTSGGQMTFRSYAWNGSEFLLDASRILGVPYEGPDRVLNDSGWHTAESQSVLLSDGVLSFEKKDASGNVLNSYDYLVSLQDMGDKSMQTYINVNPGYFAYMAFIDGSELFPAGSNAITIKVQQQADLLEYFSTNPALIDVGTVDDLLETSSDGLGNYGYYYCTGSCTTVQFELLGTAGMAGGEVRFYTDPGSDGSYENYTISGTWSRKVFGGVDVIIVNVPFSIQDENASIPAFAKDGSSVYKIYHTPAGKVGAGINLMNKAMADALLNDAGYPAAP